MGFVSVQSIVAHSFVHLLSVVLYEYAAYLSVPISLLLPVTIVNHVTTNIFGHVL